VVKVLVTGAAGQLGSEVVEELNRRDAEMVRGKGIEVVAADRARLDVADRDAVLSAITEVVPDVVIHPAAFTAVDRCESERELAFAVNALGTRHVAEGCRMVAAHLAYVSTDYVFDGEKADPYTEWDLPNPRSLYGLSKLGGERALDAAATIVRTSWVCGRNGANIVKTALRLLGEQAGPLRFVDDQHGSPSIADDVAKRLCDLALERRPGVFHVTNAGATTWYRFVQHVATAAGYDAGRVEAISTAELDPDRYPAPRPKNSVLANAALAASGLALLPPWQESTSRLVDELRHS
jgi:dTDP-4-dehydrorhamnose reductase